MLKLIKYWRRNHGKTLTTSTILKSQKCAVIIMLNQGKYFLANSGSNAGGNSRPSLKRVKI